MKRLSWWLLPLLRGQKLKTAEHGGKLGGVLMPQLGPGSAQGRVLPFSRLQCPVCRMRTLTPHS